MLSAADLKDCGRPPALCRQYMSCKLSAVQSLYINGEKACNLAKDSVPCLGDRAKFREQSKVLQRHQRQDVRLHFLLQSLYFMTSKLTVSKFGNTLPYICYFFFVVLGFSA